jgi:hypothetical protein
MEREGDVAQEPAQDRGTVAAADEIGLADEEIDADGLLVEGQSRRVLRIVRYPVVLKDAGRPSIDVGDISVRRVFSLDRLTVVGDLRIGVRGLRTLVPPTFDVRLEKPAANEAEIVIAQRRERVARASSTCADDRRHRFAGRAST